MKNRAGFTLIEMLVVITIISILASMLFPVFSKARETARKSVCASNLKQIYFAVYMYQQDWDGMYPPEAWAPLPNTLVSPELDMTQSCIYTNLKNTAVFMCPTDLDGRHVGLSYQFNDLAANRSESAIDSSSSVILLIEAGISQTNFQTFVVNGSATTTDTAIPALLFNKSNAGNIPNPMAARHNGFANVVFSDGHTRSYMFPQLTAGLFMLNNETAP
jgi:prepilin-type N-terminal cleavage/methylation domain-containing protein/prepilin-type processing-associated H-X9-DG protein